MTSLSPTSEQQRIIDAFATGQDMVVEAGAGTGKTSTLLMLAQSPYGMARKGLYLVYNNKAKKDAEEKFIGAFAKDKWGKNAPDRANAVTTTDPLTGHSLANKLLRKSAKRGLLNKLPKRGERRVYGREAAPILGVPDGGIEVGEHHFTAAAVASAALVGLRSFCQSADDEPNAYHAPKADGLEPREQKIWKEIVAPYIARAWTDVQKEQGGKLTFEHDHYLKIWALTRPVLEVDFILLDEAQDTKPVIDRVLREQTHAQKIMVGDRCQSLYEWAGAIDAMTKFECDNRLLLQQSFRFGPAVADMANVFLSHLDTPLALVGLDSINSEIVDSHTMADPDAILCRTNATCIEYALEYQEKGKRVAIVGGTKEIEDFTKAAQRIQKGQSVDHPELAAFDNWADVQQFAQSDEGADLRVKVKLIDNYGTETILAVCANSVDEVRGNADLIVSTAHKAKGAEWDRVLIGRDFGGTTEKATTLSPAELRLAYVAVTRAKLALDLGGLTDHVARLNGEQVAA